MKINLSHLILLLTLTMPVLAAENGAIKVEEAWARESPPTVGNGAAYMTLINQGKEVDRLVGAAGEVSEAIELHTHTMESGVMKMRKIEAIEVNPGEPAVLRPGGLHIMLIGLKKPLVAGQTFPLRLRFEKAGEIPVNVTVRKLAGEMHSNQKHDHEEHHEDK